MLNKETKRVISYKEELNKLLTIQQKNLILSLKILKIKKVKKIYGAFQNSPMTKIRKLQG